MVEPLYYQQPQLSMMDSTVHEKYVEKISVQRSEKFVKIFVEEPSDNFGQEVRNHLLFLMYGHGGKPSAPIYKLSLNASIIKQILGQPFEEKFNHPSGLKEFEQWSKNPQSFFPKTPTRLGYYGTVMGVGSYILKDIKNGVAVKDKNGLIIQGKGSVSTSFNKPNQLYAGVEAEKNAEKRVAEELAEKIFMLLSIDLRGL
ncbi:hypothetical protein V4P56_05290 [Bartonella sp. B35(2025)]